MMVTQQAAAGGVWIGLQQLVRVLLNMVLLIILARSLAPEIIGLAGIATSLVAIAQVLLRQGLPEAIVQQTALTEAKTTTAFWASMLLGVVLAVITSVCAPAVAALYQQPELTPLLRVLSLVFVCEAVGVIPEALLRRRFSFRFLMLRYCIAAGIAGAVAVYAALNGAGAWSLIVFPLISAGLASALLFVAVQWRPQWRFSAAALRELWPFSRDTAVRACLGVLNVRLVELLVGLLLGPLVLGWYLIAQRFLDVITALSITPFVNVTLPLFAKLTAPEQRAAAFQQLATAVAWLAFPAFAGLALILPEVLPLVLGAHWAPAIAPAQVLCAIVFTHSLSAMSLQALSGIGRSQTALKLTLLQVGANLLAVYWAAHYGLLFVALLSVAKAV